jgi:hypothetical protein
MLDTLVRHRNMVRLSARTMFVMAMLAAAGCSGLIDPSGEDETLTAEELAARTAYVEKAKGHLDTYCVSCHAGSDPTVAFMVGADAMEQRASLLAFDPPAVNLEAPASSRLLTKGAHSGPALTAQQSSDILQWIQAEREAANVTETAGPTLETAAFTPVFCTDGDPGSPTCPITTVDLSGLVEGWAGAKIKFVATPLSQDLYITNLVLEGGPEGVYIEHPLFVSWPPEGEPIPDTFDRFFNVKMNLKPTDMPAQIGGGIAPLIGFTPTNQLTITFKVVDKYRPDTGGGGGGGGGGQVGCKQVASFIANARGPLQNSCQGCHANAGNANARSAMDITGIANAGDAAMMQTVCDQVRTRINFSDTNNSGFFIAPDPAAATGHDFKFPDAGTFNNFKAAVDVWVQAEKTSQ